MLEFSVALAHPVSMNSQPPALQRSLLLAWVLSHWVLLSIIVICIFIEAALQGADYGLWGSPRWRGLTYQNGGFWRGLLGSWQPNYPTQPVAMFTTYGFLHGGFLHLFVNMITLISLGRIVIERVGQLGFTAIYVLSLLGGALGFALLSSAIQPMVGASGALFGLAGVLISWEHTALRLAREGLWPVIRVVVLLVLLNIVMYWSMDGNLAWETHLGGFLAGWFAGWAVREQRNNAT